MAGDRVELACDVTAVQQDYQLQQPRNGGDDDDDEEPLKQLASRSSFSSSGLVRLSSSSSSSRSNGHFNRHRTDGRGRRHRRYNRARNEDWLLEHGGNDDDPYHHAPVTEQGYLVLWFFNLDRKPFYR